MIKKFIQNIEKYSAKNRILLNYYIKKYDKIIDNEIKLANIKMSDAILFVGAGSIPFTPILLAQKINAKIYAIDTDKQAILTARKVISKLNLNKQITLEVNDGLTIDVKNYDVIILALQVTPLNQTLKHMLQPNNKVIIRQPFKKYAHLYDEVDASFECIDEIQQPMKYFGTSILVKKL